MLTKQERAAIAERAKICDCLHFSGLYECLLGHSVPADTSNKEDYKVFLARLIDLCDTSDMVELPIDKNGVPIHIGDTVWRSGEKETVKAIEIRKTAVYIHFIAPVGCTSFSFPELITHTDPISDHERIAQEIEEIAAANKGTVTEEDLRLVAEEIRELGDDNE